MLLDWMQRFLDEVGLADNTDLTELAAFTAQEFKEVMIGIKFPIGVRVRLCRIYATARVKIGEVAFNPMTLPEKMPEAVPLTPKPEKT